MKRAVIYARYSCSSQTEQSIEGQLSRCLAYAENNGLQVVNTYIDRAMSATTDKRPNFLQMIEDSNKHAFDCVVVYAVDRFARNTYDYEIYKHKLETNGIYLLSTTELMGVNPDGTENLAGGLVEGLMANYAQYYSRELSAKIHRGREESMRKGTFLGGIVTFGYKVIDKIVHIDEQEAPVVEEIFKRYAGGDTAIDIVDYLNGIGVVNKNGHPFSKNTILNLLKNKRYIGITTFKDIQVDNMFPRIISDELFEAAQFKRKHYSRTTSTCKDTAHYILSGKLLCGYCHSPMYGESGTARTGVTYRYYKCFERKQHGTCKKENIAKDYIEELVINTTLGYLIRPNTVDIIVEKVLAEQEEQKKKSPLGSLKKKLAQLTKETNNLINAIKMGVVAESVQNELMKLETEKAEIEHRIEVESNQAFDLTRDDILQWFETISEMKLTDDRAKRRLIDTFVHRILLYDDRIIIIYKTFNGMDSERCDIDKLLASIPLSELDNDIPPYNTYGETLIFTFDNFAVVVKRLKTRV